MTAQPNFTPRFVRRTQLATHEYHKNFHQIDQEIIRAITSREADEVTPLISKIYLRLMNAPTDYWERQGVLRFEAESPESGKQVKAWAVLCKMLGVASATASKALRWMHEQGIIGYFAGKNGVGIRIFLNRAASSIGVRAGKKILEFSPASSRKSPASQNEPTFNDSFADVDDSDTDKNPSAPKNGADNETVDKTSPESQFAPDIHGTASGPKRREVEAQEVGKTSILSVNEIVERLKSELKPTLQEAARHAARQEHERTREWLEKRGLPKAARVAQREAYNVLRSHGLVNASAERARADLGVGRNSYTVEAKPLSSAETKEMAQICIAMLEAHGQSIDATLADISSETGGCLLPEDAPKVRTLAEDMLRESEKGE